MVESNTPLRVNFLPSVNLVKDFSYHMLSTKVAPFADKKHMHLQHLYKSNFKEVVAAFIRKYNAENKFCWSTICHVEQID